MNWNIEQLKAELKTHTQIKDWMIFKEDIHRRERYFLMDEKNGKKVIGIDQDREVHSQDINVKLLVNLGKEGRQGEITKKLFREETLRPQIESAIQSAKETDYQSWGLLKEIPTQIPKVKSCDPEMLEDLNGSMEKITGEILHTALEFPKTRFNSSELFMSVHLKEMHLSNGLTHRSQQSRIYLEAAYSYTENGKSDEYLRTAWSVSPQDLSVKKLFEDASTRATYSLQTQKPLTGKYSVIVDADVLITLMTGYVSHLRTQSEYLGLPYKKIGEELIEGAQGDLMTLTLDPSLEYGAKTLSLSEMGTIEKPLTLVKDNQVVAHSVDLQYGSYLGKAPTTFQGNVVLNAGRYSHKELTQAAPQVLEILQFSGLFFSAHSGTFSSEIRLAKLYDQKTGEVKTIKGGSLSGSISENFKNAKFSQETAKRAEFDYQTSGGYFGPKYVLLSDVSVVG